MEVVQMNKVVGIYDHDKQHDIFYELSGADGKNVMHGVLYYFGVLSGLRIGDILEVTVEQIGPLVSVLEQKTGKKKEFTLDACSLMLIECYIDHKGLQTGDRLFPVS